jgi:ATP-dependent RNA helicase DDX52/ROK1
MDVFKLLSRSSTLDRHSKTPKSFTNSLLPSQGSTSNPQLFGEVEGSRKRRKLSPVNEPQSKLPTELDFFHKPSSNANSSKPQQELIKEEPLVDTDIETFEPADDPAQLDEEAIKQILKQHKLKIGLVHYGEELSVDSNAKSSGALYPRPLTSFSQLRSTYDLSKRLVQNVAKQGYKIPTEVQMGSLPLQLIQRQADTPPDPALKHISSDRDLLVVAPTGSGKTMAFLVPTLSNILQEKHSAEKVTRNIRSVIVAPTRELLQQIHNEAKKLTQGIGIKVSMINRGMRLCEHGHPSQVASASEESESDSDEVHHPHQSHATVSIPDLLVTTPLSLVNALNACSDKDCTPLSKVTRLILDEADVLLDRLFQDQTIQIWDSCSSPALRVSLWSATMGASIEELAKAKLCTRRKALKLNSGPESYSILRLIVGLKDTAIPNITQKLIYTATEPGKLLALRQALRPSSTADGFSDTIRPPIIVFTQTITRATALHAELKYDIPAAAGGSFRIAVLHAGLSDTTRTSIMTRFRNGEIWILITTDLLSRGIDFRGVNGVVNYDIPISAASYVHRVGRTGRAGRNGGVALTFYTKEDIPYVKNIANIISSNQNNLSSDNSGKDGPGGVPKWLLDALPRPSKKMKKKLRYHGIDSRADSAGAKTADKEAEKLRRRSRISTKSGYQRRVEHRFSHQNDPKNGVSEKEKIGDEDFANDGEWGGIED